MRDAARLSFCHAGAARGAAHAHAHTSPAAIAVTPFYCCRPPSSPHIDPTPPLTRYHLLMRCRPTTAHHHEHAAIFRFFAFVRRS